MDALPFNRPKKDIADYIVEVLKSHPSTTWTALVSGPFFDWALAFGLFGFETKKHKATIYDNGTTTFDATNIGTVGRAVANILSKPDKYQNERLYISGMTITQNDIFEALKKATGVQDWEVDYRTAESLRQQGQERMSKGDFMGITDIIDASSFQDGNGANYSAIRKLENSELGVHDDLNETVQEVVKRLQ